MNNFRLATFGILRAYATRANAGIRKRLNLARMDDDISDEFEHLYENEKNMDQPDLMEITTDYINDRRDRERTREQLKRRIVKAKVFKESAPRFLTLAEIEEMKKLHASDPQEWSPERLSESFPALPDVVRRVLNVHWTPRTVEIAVSYDSKVIENWEKFKTGKLVLHPRLEEHLMKFKNRKIELMDRKTIETRFLRPRMEFPKAKSTFFSSIVQDSVKQKKRITDPKQLISSPNDTDQGGKNLIAANKENGKLRTKKNHAVEETLVFQEFLKKKLNNLDGVSVEEKIALMETVRKETESKNVDVSLDMLNAAAKDTAVEEKRVSAKTNSSDALAVRKDKKFESKVVIEVSTDNVSLDTYVKKRISHMDTEFNYIKPIKIPKNVYKEGMTYRVRDCYYDYDGQFLYRVPGLKA